LVYSTRLGGIDVLKKRIRMLNDLQENVNLLACPVCGESLVPGQEGLTCQKGHHFDPARQGYLHLNTGRPGDFYDRGLFEARRRMIRSGLYGPLLNRLAEMICGWTEKSGRDPVVLDAGCGEGSHLQELHRKGIPGRLVGMDISREAVRMAAGDPAGILWLVGDMNRIPLLDSSTDVILNILSPAGYREFLRILRPDGLVIKVVPEPEYLLEIRRLLPGNGQPYDNSPVVEGFRQHFSQTSYETISWKVPVLPETLRDLLVMTPMTRGRNPEEILPGMKVCREITVSLGILSGFPSAASPPDQGPD